MPLFEFECPNCKHKFEELTSLSERDKVLCPKCGAKPERLMSGFVSQSGSGSSGILSSGGSCSSPSGFS